MWSLLEQFWPLACSCQLCAVGKGWTGCDLSQTAWRDGGAWLAGLGDIYSSSVRSIYGNAWLLHMPFAYPLKFGEFCHLSCIVFSIFWESASFRNPKIIVFFYNNDSRCRVDKVQNKCLHDSFCGKIARNLPTIIWWKLFLIDLSADGQALASETSKIARSMMASMILFFWGVSLSALRWRESSFCLRMIFRFILSGKWDQCQTKLWTNGALFWN